MFGRYLLAKVGRSWAQKIPGIAPGKMYFD
jgi:hypothetical protein